METCFTAWFWDLIFMKTMTVFVFIEFKMLVFTAINGIQTAETSRNI